MATRDPFVGTPTDDFERASLGANWSSGLYPSNGGNLVINSSTRCGGEYSNFATNGYHAIARWVGTGTPTKSQFASLKIDTAPVSVGNNYELGVAVRCGSGTDASREYYEFYTDGLGKCILAKVVAGTQTLLVVSTAGVSFAANDYIELECEESGGVNTLTPMKNGVAIGSAGITFSTGSTFTITDSSISATGAPGACSNSSVYGSEWTGGNLTTGGSSSLPPIGFIRSAARGRASNY